MSLLALGSAGVPPTIVLLAVGLAFVLMGLVAWWAYDEGDVRGVNRRASSSGKTAAAGVTLGMSGVVGVLVGFGEGVFAGLGSLSGQLSSHAGFVVDIGLAGLGASVVTGAWTPSSVYAFLAVCGLVVVGGVLWRGS